VDDEWAGQQVVQHDGRRRGGAFRGGLLGARGDRSNKRNDIRQSSEQRTGEQPISQRPGDSRFPCHGSEHGDRVTGPHHVRRGHCVAGTVGDPRIMP
jgi:hypothetical protein